MTTKNKQKQLKARKATRKAKNKSRAARKAKKPAILKKFLKWGSYGVAALSFIGLLLSYLGYLPTDILTPESELSVDIASKGVKELIPLYPQNNVIDIFNPYAQDNQITQLNLWLENKKGRTTIYTKTITVMANEGFWTSFIDSEQFELKPGQTEKIPLKFTPVNYSDIKPYLKVEILINYETKGKLRSKHSYKIIKVRP